MDDFAEILTAMEQCMDKYEADFISVNINTKDNKLVTLTVQNAGDNNDAE